MQSLVSEGLSNKEIGRRLNIADGTIQSPPSHHIFQKLDIGNRAKFWRHWRFRRTNCMQRHVN